MDLRAGAALVIAGLAAEGITELSNINFIDRGYEHMREKLTELGADISRA
jgi:UDP-N-acetylglucosamine 1-carboxyvinyltransferase